MSDEQGTFSIDIEKVSEELRVRSEIYKRLLISFSKSLNDKLEIFREAFTSDDVTKMRAILHEIKGTSGNLRVNNVFEATDKLHVGVKSGEPKEQLTEDFEVLQNKSREFLDYIAKIEA